ncbi:MULTISPECIES: helix-turn-helix transcriptional regulator [unclassified Bradyrhizobium]|nr:MULTISPECIES: helix-turn-helix transcriptional regulator [unclassified Bradyrhizobium]
MQDWCSIVGRNVRRLRQSKRMTQEELAFEAQIDLTYVGGIERGRRNPSLLVMARIARALSVPITKLFVDS